MCSEAESTLFNLTRATTSQSQLKLHQSLQTQSLELPDKEGYQNHFAQSR